METNKKIDDGKKPETNTYSEILSFAALFVEIAIRSAIPHLGDIDIENLFDKEMNSDEIKICRDELKLIVSNADKWNLLKALEISMAQNQFEAFRFLIKSKENSNQ